MSIPKSIKGQKCSKCGRKPSSKKHQQWQRLYLVKGFHLCWSCHKEIKGVIND